MTKKDKEPEIIEDVKDDDSRFEKPKPTNDEEFKKYEEQVRKFIRDNL